IDDISITSGGSGGGNPTPPTADFTADRVSIQEGESINFTDLSTNNPTSWSWTFNGGSPSTSNQQNPSVSYATAGTYTVSLTVTNADGNDTETKTNYITVSTTPPPPNGNGCTGGINSFPYAEGFESNLGGWIQASNDGIDWIRDANGTSSSSTGPNSATEGNLYLYTEASNGNSNSTAILTSPCFDLSNQANATFNFAYHMYGSDMGSLMVEVSTNGGSSWVSLWSESGDKGNQWKTASISLSPYAGQSIQLRFVGLTGPSFRSDMAIDDISITSGGNGGGNPTPPVADFSADRFTIQEGQSINFTDLSTNNPTSWSWTFNGGTPGTSNQQNPTVSYSTAGIYTVVLTVTNADGSDTETKTNYITVSTTPPPPNGNGCTGGITNFPYSEGFENGLGGWIQASNDDMDWTIDLNGTPSSSTGPSSAIEGNDYLYTEASGGNSNSTAILTSPCFDLSNIVSATFSFGYHMYGSNMGTLTVQISNDDGANWTDLWQESGNKGNQWLSANLNLDSYAGGTIQVRFVGLTGSSFRSDMAIDNINLTASSARLANAEVKPGKENKETYRVYPNPTRNNLLLEMTSANYGPLTIIITDIMGRELIRQKLEQNPGFNSYNIDVSGFDAGTYILIALDDEKRVIERFIKKN
ncbi:MAG: PKD domain-containing protein, partial [Bacteroidota bacterium]